MTTFQERTVRRDGVRGWSRTRWFVILGVVAAAVVIAVLVMLYTGGGGGASGGRGY